MAELDATMSAREFRRWAAFLNEEPLLPERVDLAGGLVAFMLASINRGKNAPRPELDDFMLVAQAIRERQRQAEAAAMTIEEAQDRMLRSFVLQMGGTIANG